MHRPVDSSRAVSVARMQSLDAKAIESLGIPRLLLMEHAGQALARAAADLLPSSSRVLACCGTGYNGGDGLCAAWHLAHRGHKVAVVVLAGSGDELREEPAVYAKILRALGVPIRRVREPQATVALARAFSRADLVIDALLGIGTRGAVRPLAAAVIERINRCGKPVVAADVPSGLDADTGRPQGCAVRAAVTVTFGEVKRGLLRGEGPAHAGRVVLDDLEMPRGLHEASRW